MDKQLIYNIEHDKIFNTLKFLFYLFPIFIVVGNFLLNSLFVISLLLMIYLSSRYDCRSIFINKGIIYLSLFFLYLIISSIISGETYSIIAAIKYLRFYFFAILIFVLLKIDRKFERYFSLTFVSILILVSIDGIFQYFFNFNLVGIKTIIPHRISGFFGDELILGSFIAKYLFLFFIYFIVFNKKRTLFMLISVLLIITTFISGERTAFFSIVLFSILYFIKIFDFKKILFFFSSILIIVNITIFYDPVIKDRMIYKTIKDLKILREWKNPKKIQFFTDDHNSHFQSAYLMYKKGDIKNKLFGRGVKSFRLNCDKKEFCDKTQCCSTHPHNLFFQILSEIGLIGIGIFLYFYLYLLSNYFKSVKLDSIRKKRLSLYSSLLVCLFPLITSGNIFGSFFSANLFFIIPYVIFLEEYDKKDLKNNFIGSK